MSAAETRPSRYYFQFVAYRLDDIADGFGALAERISRVSLPVEREGYKPFRVQQTVAWGSGLEDAFGSNDAGLEQSGHDSPWTPYLVRLAVMADDERHLAEILRDARRMVGSGDREQKLRDGMEGLLPSRGAPVGEWRVTVLHAEDLSSSGFLGSTWRGLSRGV